MSPQGYAGVVLTFMAVDQQRCAMMTEHYGRAAGGPAATSM
ncbi:hypothetical protein [Mycolicibacterium litorale]|nr:hypothetical protein [Mycolicibacterium litorale]